MLLKLTGSSCSGKTTLALALVGRLPQLAVHDFDELGVPDNADLAWRHRMTEHWVVRALEYQDRGIDLLLTGQSPLGEVLAAPSAPMLDGIALCLVDVTDDVRRHRLTHRDPDHHWDPSAIGAFISWASWHRGHALNPRYEPDVIIKGGWSGMVWERWAGWATEDRRWHTDMLDTTGRPVLESVGRVERWLTAQRKMRRSGQLALARGWAL